MMMIEISTTKRKLLLMSPKRMCKDREQAILLGLVDLYLLTGKPIGSNTLKKNGFGHISAATIRNYLAKLEIQGMLKQQHASSGRVPTSLAYKFYAHAHINCKEVDQDILEVMKSTLDQDTREIVSYLQSAAELLSNLTQGAIFLSSPRFDQDLLVDIKLMKIDVKRYLCVIITDFGLIHTEILYTSKKLNSFSLKRIEAYFHFRMTGLNRPVLNTQEEEVAIQFYNEILLRHIVNYSNFSNDDIYKTGFSKLIQFFEFRDAAVLATGLSIFENTEYMRGLLNICIKNQDMQFWIGNDLEYSSTSTLYSSIVAIPYFIHGKVVGSIALLGPIRMSYPKIFGIMRVFSEIFSKMLTRNFYKYKITYRQSTTQQIAMQTTLPTPLIQEKKIQLEDQNEEMFNEKTI